VAVHEKMGDEVSAFDYQELLAAEDNEAEL
jgi:hypothetical protein